MNCLCTWFRFDQDAAGVRFGAQSLQEQGQEGSVAMRLATSAIKKGSIRELQAWFDDWCFPSAIKWNLLK